MKLLTLKLVLCSIVDNRILTKIVVRTFLSTSKLNRALLKFILFLVLWNAVK